MHPNNKNKCKNFTKKSWQLRFPSAIGYRRCYLNCVEKQIGKKTTKLEEYTRKCFRSFRTPDQYYIFVLVNEKPVSRKSAFRIHFNFLKAHSLPVQLNCKCICAGRNKLNSMLMSLTFSNINETVAITLYFSLTHFGLNQHL